MLRHTAGSSEKHSPAQTTRWYAHPSFTARIPRPNVIPTALFAVNNHAANKAPIPLVRNVCAEAPASVSDEEGWSDFDDDPPTVKELARLNAQFEQDTRDIERFNIENNVPNFNRRDVPPPPRRTSSLMTTVTNTSNSDRRT
jgi:hypothetical protein